MKNIIACNLNSYGQFHAYNQVRIRISRKLG